MRVLLPFRHWVVGLGTLLVLGCPVADLGDDPPVPGRCLPDFAQFRDQIWPLAIAPADNSKSCVSAPGCHERSTGRSIMRLIANPVDDADHQGNYNIVTSSLNCSTPSASEFITRPQKGIDRHGGGDIWLCPGADCDLINTVEMWIAQ